MMQASSSGFDAAGIACVRAPNASAYTSGGTNSYLVAGDGGHCLLIDPACPDPAYLQQLLDVAEPRGGIETILITHGHPDHNGGAQRVRESTGAPVVASRLYDGSPVDRRLAEGDVVPLGGRSMRVYETPGHRFDHLCFLLGDAGVLIAGDLVSGEGTVLIAPPEGDLGHYLASLRRMLALRPALLLPGHGPPETDPAGRLQAYIDHRLLREEQVLRTLAAGATTVDDLVDGIYPDLDQSLRRAAALTMQAHVNKLLDEGRIESSSGGLWISAATSCE